MRLKERAELHLVTNYPVPPQAGVFHYSNLPPNSETLVNLYRNADIFALPTRADCLAVVLGEAMAASLPIITTNVGAHSEAVRDGCTGIIIPRDDIDSLSCALERLVDDAELRREMGTNARCLAEERFDARKNARLIVSHMRHTAQSS
jgi:glycosyltransferase involved in cell wall biosynthesis